MLASGLKGEFDVDGETVVVDALIDLDFICNQETATEAGSFEDAPRATRRGRPGAARRSRHP